MSKIQLINEFQLSEDQKEKIWLLLKNCFPESDYGGRNFFKQLPHYRLLLTYGEKIIGHLGIDYRVMNLGGEIIRIFGGIDLAVDPNFRNRGLGAQILKEFEEIALANKNNIDFLFLVTDIPDFYQKLGYTTSVLRVSWLKISQGRNIGIGEEKISDSFLLYKEISGKKWTEGNLDMLGYMF